MELKVCIVYQQACQQQPQVAFRGSRRRKYLFCCSILKLIKHSYHGYSCLLLKAEAFCFLENVVLLISCLKDSVKSGVMLD